MFGSFPVPVAGKTGTYTDSDVLNDRTYLRSKALAGVITTAGGRELTFCIFVNDLPLPRGTEASRLGKVIGRLCEIVQQHDRKASRTR